uniref:Reverse transcriptase domain-containing protein n=1 Tax=Peronospora matthiolae TaxID=2874970 RepID=A0AAV1V4Y1_9STRA
MPGTIDSAQVGFVPGRAIDTALYILAAAKIAATIDEPMRRSLEILLDFSKPNDSL